MPITAATLYVDVQANTLAAQTALQQFSSSLGNIGGQLQKLGLGLTLGLTLPLKKAGEAALELAGDYETNMLVLQATTGATSREIQMLRDEAWRLGADLTLPATSAADAADAMTQLSKAGLQVNDVLAAARGTIQLSIAGQIKNAKAAEITANALNAFNLEGAEATRVADMLAAASNRSSAKITELARALKMSSAVYAIANIPIEDLMTGLAMLANAGIKSSDAGTSLKQMLLRLQAPSNNAANIMKKLGISIYDSEGRMVSFEEIIGRFNVALSGLTEQERNYYLVKLFGSDAIRAANVVLRAGVDEFRSMRTELTKGGEAAALAEARTQGLGGSFEALTTAIETTMLAAVDPFKTDIEDSIRGIAAWINSFSELDATQRRSIVTMLGFAAAIGPASLILGTMFKIVGGGISVITAFGTAAATAFRAWQAGLTLTTALGAAGLSPIVITLGAIAAAVGSVIAVWATWNKQIVETNKSGQEAVQAGWDAFFQDLIASGADAGQIIDEFNEANQRVTDSLANANPFVRLFISNVDELYGSTDDLNRALAAASDSYTVYAKAAHSAGLEIFTEEAYEQARAIFLNVDALQAEADQILRSSRNYEEYKIRMQQAGIANMALDQALFNTSKNIIVTTEELEAFEDAVEETKLPVMALSDMLDGLSTYIEEAGGNASISQSEIDDLRITLGEVSEEELAFAEAVDIVNKAMAYGVIGLEEYTVYAWQASEGTLALSGAQKESMRAAIAQAEATKRASAAITEFRLAQLELAPKFSDVFSKAFEEFGSEIEKLQKKMKAQQSRMGSLKFLISTTDSKKKIAEYREELNKLSGSSANVTKKIEELQAAMQNQIGAALAQEAISRLGQLYDDNRIGLDEYILAVQETQTMFGLVNDEGTALATGLLLVLKAFEDGALSAENFDDKLAQLAEKIATGQLDITDLAGSLDLANASATEATDPIEQFQYAMDDLNNSSGELSTAVTSDMATAETAVTGFEAVAQQASADIQSAFQDRDWAGLGQGIATSIARGIGAGTPLIVQAAKAAARAAYAAAMAALGMGSPSKLFVAFGKNIPKSIALGINDESDLPSIATRSMLEDIVPTGFKGAPATTQHGGDQYFEINQTFNNEKAAALGLAQINRLKNARLAGA